MAAKMQVTKYNDQQIYVHMHVTCLHICIKFDLVEAWYSLETVHWFEGRQAFIHYCGLHQV